MKREQVGAFDYSVWIDKFRHVEFDRHVSDALVYGLGAMNVTQNGIRYVPFRAVVSSPSSCTLAKAVRACVGIPEPELAKVDSDYVRAV